MLSFMQKTISLARFAKDPERIAREIEKAGTVYKIKRPNGKTLLVMDEVELYWREYLSHYPDWRKDLAEGERELREGKCAPLDGVIADLRKRAKRAARGGRAEAGRPRPGAARPQRSSGRSRRKAR